MEDELQGDALQRQHALDAGWADGDSLAMTSIYSPEHTLLGRSPRSVGKSASKPLVAWADLLSLLLCFLAWGVGVAAVSDNRLAWHLGYTNQLVVVGFVLSVMYYCFKWIVPTFFLLLEARWGKSTLQNFDAILTDSTLTSRVDWWWRGTLWALLALQLGLSAAYKVCGIASARVPLDQSSDLWVTEFGLNSPPGLLPLGGNAGLLLMMNVTAPFLQISSNQSAKLDPEWINIENDMPLPAYPHAVGFNILLIDPETTALLDTPPPDWIAHVQGEIGYDDIVTIEADVLGTVSSYDPSASSHTDPTDPWWNFDPVFSGSSNITSQELIWFYNGQPQGYDQSRSNPCFISLHSNTTAPSENATMYNTFRRQCHGTWTITQHSMYLDSGSCNIAYEPPGTQGTLYKKQATSSSTLPAQSLPTPSGSDESAQSPLLLNSRSQLIFSNNSALDLASNYVPLLKEILTPFSVKTASHWKKPTMVTSVAAMYWSRVTAAQGPSSPHHWTTKDYGGFSIINFQDPEASIQYPDTTVRYQSEPVQLVWQRPAMRKAAALYVVLAVLPVLSVAALVGIAVLYHVPLGKGFGLVAILAGVDRETLGVVEGAGWSGDLTTDVFVDFGVEVKIAPDEVDRGQDVRMRYRLNASRRRTQRRPDRVRKAMVLS